MSGSDVAYPKEASPVKVSNGELSLGKNLGS